MHVELYWPGYLAAQLLSLAGLCMLVVALAHLYRTRAWTSGCFALALGLYVLLALFRWLDRLHMILTNLLSELRIPVSIPALYPRGAHALSPWFYLSAQLLALFGGLGLILRLRGEGASRQDPT